MNKRLDGASGRTRAFTATLLGAVFTIGVSLAEPFVHHESETRPAGAVFPFAVVSLPPALPPHVEEPLPQPEKPYVAAAYFVSGTAVAEGDVLQRLEGGVPTRTPESYLYGERAPVVTGSVAGSNTFQASFSVDEHRQEAGLLMFEGPDSQAA